MVAPYHYWPVAITKKESESSLVARNLLPKTTVENLGRMDGKKKGGGGVEEEL